MPESGTLAMHISMFSFWKPKHKKTAQVPLQNPGHPQNRTSNEVAIYQNATQKSSLKKCEVTKGQGPGQPGLLETGSAPG
jgi:hypothetical protein